MADFNKFIKGFETKPEESPKEEKTDKWILGYYPLGDDPKYLGANDEFGIGLKGRQLKIFNSREEAEKEAKRMEKEYPSVIGDFIGHRLTKDLE